MRYPDWEPAPFIPVTKLFDEDKLFLGPVEAATHAIRRDHHRRKARAA